MDSIPLKQCKDCLQFFPNTADYFHPSPTCKDGFRGKCKLCVRRIWLMPKTAYPPMPPGTKRCSRCKECKPATTQYFWKNCGSSDGFTSRCRICGTIAQGGTRPPREIFKGEVPEGFKHCYKCKQIKPLSAFNKHKQHSDGLKRECIACCKAYQRRTPASRRAWLKFKYNITLEQYDALLAVQGGVCAICGKEETLINKLSQKLQPLSVDHNHETGEIRALLCHHCNMRVAFVETKLHTGLWKKTTDYLAIYKDG